MTVKEITLETNIYQELYKNLENKNKTLQFLPASLESITNDKHFTFKEKKLKSSYVVDIIHNLILKYYFKKDNRFNLSSEILKEKYGHLYNYYIEYLVDKRFIILISKHLKGKNSRIYSLNESLLRSTIKRYNNTDKFLIKKFKSKVNQILKEDNEESSSLIHPKVKKKLVNDLFCVEIELYRSVFFLQSLKDGDLDIYNKNKYSVECINEKDIFYHFDSYGRMHTNFTILKSFIRKNCLLIDGQPTTEIDIKNSQPLFLCKLLIDSKSNLLIDEELDLFKYLTIHGKYYQYLMDSLKIKDRDLVKEMTYKVLFGRNNPNSQADKNFKSLFPSIHNYIRNYKKINGDYRCLAYELQKAESNLVFNKIVRQIMNSNPEIKIITVHDSIITSQNHKDTVSSIFHSKLYEEFGLI